MNEALLTTDNVIVAPGDTVYLPEYWFRTKGPRGVKVSRDGTVTNCCMRHAVFYSSESAAAQAMLEGATRAVKNAEHQLKQSKKELARIVELAGVA